MKALLVLISLTGVLALTGCCSYGSFDVFPFNCPECIYDVHGWKKYKKPKEEAMDIKEKQDLLNFVIDALHCYISEVTVSKVDITSDSYAIRLSVDGSPVRIAKCLLVETVSGGVLIADKVAGEIEDVLEKWGKPLTDL
jgi:hypothetical protein